jgi:hypothetical protein
MVLVIQAIEFAQVAIEVLSFKRSDRGVAEIHTHPDLK